MTRHNDAWCELKSRPRFGSSFPAECHGRNLMVKLEWRLGRNMVWCWWPRHIHDTGDSVCQCQINNQQINSTTSGASVNSWFKHGWMTNDRWIWSLILPTKIKVSIWENLEFLVCGSFWSCILTLSGHLWNHRVNIQSILGHCKERNIGYY